MSSRSVLQSASFVLAILLAGGIATCLCAAQDLSKEPIEIPIRIVWGGNEAYSYRGQISFQDSSFDLKRELSLTNSGTVDELGNELTIDDPKTRFGGCNLVWRGRFHSEMTLRFESMPNEQNAIAQVLEKKVSIESLLESQQELSLGKTARVVVDRSPGDRLAVTNGTKSYVFEPNQALPLQITPRWTGWKNQSVVLDWSLLSSKSQTTLQHGSFLLQLNESGSAEPIRLDSIHAPAESGAFELQFQLRPRRNLANAFSNSTIERRVEFVVTAGSKQTALSPSMQRGAGKFDWPKSTLGKSFQPDRHVPVALGAWDRFSGNFSNNWRKFGSGWNDVEEVKLEIRPGDTLRVPIDIETPARPVVISFVSDSPLHCFNIGINEVYQRNKEPAIRPIVAMQIQPSLSELLSAKSSLNAESNWVGNLGQSNEQSVLRRHKFRFTPTQKQIDFQLTNNMYQRSMELRNFRIEVDSEAPYEPSADVQSGAIELLSIEQWQELAQRGRRISGLRYDTWNSLTSVLEEWLKGCKERGAQSVAIPVVSSGGCLFPTNRLSNSPCFDTGCFDSLGRDPEVKDVVHWLYNACERYGLNLIPVFDWNFSLRSFKKLRVNVHHYASIVGQSLGGKEPWNPFQTDVQSEMKALLKEFETRYSQLPGYSGYAFLSDHESRLSLPNSIEHMSESIIDHFVLIQPGKVPQDLEGKRKTLLQLYGGTLEDKYRQQCLSLWEDWQHDLRYIFASVPHKSMRLEPSRIQLVSIQKETRETETLVSRRLWQDGPLPIIYRSDLNDSRSIDTAGVVGYSSWLPTGVSVESKPLQRKIDRIKVWRSTEAQRAFVLNANPWETHVSLSWNVLPGDIRTNTPTQRYSNPQLIHTEVFVIPAYQHRELSWINPNAVVTSWNSNESETVERLQRAMQQLESIANQSSVPVEQPGLINNSGFELEDGKSTDEGIPGWLTSLNPLAPVSLSQQLPHRGKSHLMIQCDTSGATAWLQSYPFDLNSNRFQLSLQYRLSQSAPARLQWTLTAWNGAKERYDVVGRKRLDIDPSRPISQDWTKWTEDFTEELMALGDEMRRTARLQLDIQSSTTIEIDSLGIATNYLLERERMEFRNGLFLARRALSEGQSDAAFRLLESSLAKTLFLWGAERESMSSEWPPQRTTSNRDVIDQDQEKRPISKRGGTDGRPGERRWRFWNR